ncbi:MAG: CARDB domain-containing protein [Methanobacteriota archaeon]
MMKQIVIGMLCVFLILPSCSSMETKVTPSLTEFKNGDAPQGGAPLRDFTHTVLGEEATATWCGFCPYVIQYLDEIYHSGLYDFYYVALVADKNPYASQRVLDELEVTGYPTVFYDGGYRQVLGAGGGIPLHTAAINECGARAVANIDLNLTVTWNVNAQLDVTLNITNNEATEYSGHIHAYVTEIDSRWWNQGVQYHFAMIGDYALNQNVTIPAEGTSTYFTVWDGAAYGFEDISPENIMVIVSVFRSGTNYVDETAAVIPQNLFLLPDLTCSINSYELVKNMVVFHTTISNTGLIDAQNVLVELFENDPFQGGICIEEATCYVHVPAQTEIPLDIVIPLPPGWEPGYTTDLYLIVDRLNQIDEVNEVNNVDGPFFFVVGWSSPTFHISTGMRPVISGNKIVWHDYRNGNYDIYLYDLGPDGMFGTTDDSGEIRITTDPMYQAGAVISGNKIVWHDNRNGNYDIYLYDLGPDGMFGTTDDSGEIRITTDPMYQWDAAISRNKIVWFENQSSDQYNIYLYDLGPDGIFGTADDSGEIRITTNQSRPRRPAIYENKIVWQDSTNWTNPDIYLYDLGPDGLFGTADDSGEIRIATDLSSQSRPAISGNKIVWHDVRSGKSCVYLYDLGPDGLFGTGDDSGEIKISTNESIADYPSIWGNKIVWHDYRNSNYDIYLYDLGEDGLFGTIDDSGEIWITASLLTEVYPVISGDKIVYEDYGNSEIYLVELEVEYHDCFIDTGETPAISENKLVWQDDRYNNEDIFLYDIGSDGLFGTADDNGVVRITTDSYDSCCPSISGNKIVWQDNRYGNEDIFLYDLGPDGLFGTADDSGEIRVTTNSFNQENPAISGNKIIWVDSGEDHGIYLYDLGPDGIFGTEDDSGEIRIITYSPNYPDISGNKIVWGVSGNVFLYDLGPDGIFGTADDSGEIRITTDSFNAFVPSISGNKIIWEHMWFPGFTWDIYLYDLGPDGIFGTTDDSGYVRVTTDPTQQWYSDISGNKIVWMDGRNGNYDIYLYDLGPDGLFGTEDDSRDIQITSSSAHQKFPAISEDKIVYENYEHGDPEIYLFLKGLELDPYHFRILEKYPFFLAQVDSGSAVMRMMLNYLMWNKIHNPEGPPDIYNETTFFNNYSGGDVINGDELTFGLNQEINDPGNNWQYGYFYSAHGHQDANDALKDLAIWIDYNISQYNDLREVDVPKPGHPYHTPAAIPLDGDYSHWITVRGIHTDRVLWQDNHTIISGPVTIYGFWVNDPTPSGIGGNTYVTAQRLIDQYFLPLDVSNDPYDNQFLVIVDPPQGVDVEEDNVAITVAETEAAFSVAEAQQLFHAHKGRGMNKISADKKITTTAYEAAWDILRFDNSHQLPFTSARPTGVPLLMNDEYIVRFIDDEGITYTVITSLLGSLLEIRVDQPPVLPNTIK